MIKLIELHDVVCVLGIGEYYAMSEYGFSAWMLCRDNNMLVSVPSPRDISRQFALIESQGDTSYRWTVDVNISAYYVSS
jgi:hypothetical protein